MRRFVELLRDYKYESYLVAFTLMALPPVPMYFAAQQGARGWIWGLIGVVVLGNIIALVVR